MMYPHFGEVAVPVSGIMRIGESLICCMKASVASASNSSPKCPPAAKAWNLFHQAWCKQTHLQLFLFAGIQIVLVSSCNAASLFWTPC